jgi:hypothetical protein
MVGFYLIMMTVYFVHAFVDCMCTVLILFYPNKISKTDSIESHPSAVVVDDDNKNSISSSSIDSNKASSSSLLSSSVLLANININASGAESFFKWWNGLLDIYSLLFLDSVISEPIFMRVFMYWMAAMSLTRVMVLGWPCASTLTTVAVMYLLEALAIEFESFTHKTVRPDYGRRFSFFCMCMCAFSLLLAIFV